MRCLICSVELGSGNGVGSRGCCAVRGGAEGSPGDIRGCTKDFKSMKNSQCRQCGIRAMSLNRLHLRQPNGTNPPSTAWGALSCKNKALFHTKANPALHTALGPPK